MISDTLKQETAACHDAIENAKRFARMGSEDFSREEYIELLTRLYGFYKPLEQSFRQNTAVMEALDYQNRFKLPLLTRDLAYFGYTDEALAQLPECTALPAMTTPADLLGCIYVMEGSTHGAQYIAKRLQAQLNLDGQGLAYYQGYGQNTMSQWKAFKQYLDETVDDKTRGAQVVNAATQTFQALQQWMDA